MFYFSCYELKMANFHKSVVTTPNVHTDFFEIVLYFFSVSMKTTGARSLKFGIRLLGDGLQCE